MKSEDMRNLEARGMQPVTSYAPARISLLGLTEAVFGLIVLGMGALAIWATSAGEMRPTKPGDMPEWWMYLVGAALALGGLALFTSGLGRMLSALARNCFSWADRRGSRFACRSKAGSGISAWLNTISGGIRSRGSRAIFIAPTLFQ